MLIVDELVLFIKNTFDILRFYHSTLSFIQIPILFNFFAPILTFEQSKFFDDKTRLKFCKRYFFFVEYNYICKMV